MLLNNTLLARVYNKPLIVLFSLVVDTLSITEGSIPHGEVPFLVLVFSLKVNQPIRRAFTGTSKSNNSVRIQYIEARQSFQVLSIP